MPTRNLAVDATCLLTQVTYSFGEDGEDFTGGQSGNFLYLMHGSAINSNGDMFFIGTTASSYLLAGGNYDGIAFRIDEEGNLMWTTSFGGTDNDFGADITHQGTSYVYATGNTKATTDYDIFVVKMATSDGEPAWEFTYGRTGNTAYNERGYGIHYYSDAIYVAAD
jgi:hypothetical protein